MDVPLFVYPFTSCWAQRLLPVSIMNNAGMSSYIQVFLWMHVFIFLGYIPKSASIRSY